MARCVHFAFPGDVCKRYYVACLLFVEYFRGIPLHTAYLLFISITCKIKELSTCKIL